MTITSLHGDCLNILPTLTPGAVQALITSPPYYGLRSYDIPPSSWPAVAYTPLIGLPPITIAPMVCQLGAEPDPLAYIGHLVHVFRLARPAMRKDATLWVNLGDSYSGNTEMNGARHDSTSRAYGAKGNKAGDLRSEGRSQGRRVVSGLADKNLLGIPARAALALQADGWVWRNDIIWHAPNKMPESVRDRFTRAHEDILFFGNGPRYYFDSEAVAEPVSEKSTFSDWNGKSTPYAKGAGMGIHEKLGNGSRGSPAGRNRRDVWSIATTPMPAHLRGGDEAHYAAWPPALVEVMVKAATANKACGVCGAAWVRQVEKKTNNTPVAERNGREGHNGAPPQQSGWFWKPPERRDLGFAPACGCAADPARCVVLDPFGGTGITGAVCEALGRDCILIDLGYQTLQARRTDEVQIDMEAYL